MRSEEDSHDDDYDFFDAGNDHVMMNMTMIVMMMRMMKVKPEFLIC